MQTFAVLLLFIGYGAALPVYMTPMRMGRNSGYYHNGGKHVMENGPGGTGGIGTALPFRRRGDTPPVRISNEVDGNGDQPTAEGGAGEGGAGEGGAGEGGAGEGGAGGEGGEFISSSESAGANFDPTAPRPTLPPGGAPTEIPMPLRFQTVAATSVGVILALGLIVGLAIGGGIYIIKKKA